ncbi:MAG: long-chain fatty acid--CoA ligase [Actinobacteria bacterium]|nr:MAG: long-chain fatty acid--CoA ligase [Actinomycetota bacterium]REK36434.1 MAG: long-chain fatty acid--CoA ligase [Actinomycetota bacterium]
MNQEAVLSERAEIDAVVEGKTIVDYFNRNADRHGDKPAIHWKKNGQFEHLTWARYRDVVHQAAAGLASLGVEKDEFVAIMAGNRPEHVIADYAVVHSGATPVTIYSTLAASQIQYIADNCNATVAILEDLEFMKRWEEIRSELPNLEYVVLMSGAENYDTADWVLSWDELLARGTQKLQDDPDVINRAVDSITPDTLATLIYTSGTTGTPKGVMISQHNVVWTVECLRRGANLKLGARMVSYLPLAHIAERLATHYLGTYLAGEVWFCPNLAGVLEYIQEARPTLFVGVPRVYEKFHSRLLARFEEASGVKGFLLNKALEANAARVAAEENGGSGSALAGILDKIALSKVREGLGMESVEIAITAAAPINPDLVRFFQTIGIPLFELYGMSETTGPATSNVPGAAKIGSVGRPLPGVGVRIDDDGEVLMSGGVITAGYYKLPEASAETFDEDGWLHSGDLGRIDEDGFLWIVGRKKDIIITAAGKNIAPAKLETLLGNHPLVSKACMVGDGRKFLTMIVALDHEEAPIWAESHGLEYQDLKSFAELPAVQEEIANAVEAANQEVARVEQIKKWVIVGDEWTPDSGEVTPSLKLKRNVVLEKYSAEIESLYQGV